MLKVYDNFLSDSDFKLIERLFISSEFPWYYSDDIAGDEEGLDAYQMVHSFFDVKNPFRCNGCKYSKFLGPLFTKLSPECVLRVKANLRPRTSQPFQSKWHTDTRIKSKTAIFYINSNNGYTAFKDDDMRVYSLANRLVLFDSHIEHSGVSCTSDKRRIVLNINYVPQMLNNVEQIPLGELVEF